MKKGYVDLLCAKCGSRQLTGSPLTIGIRCNACGHTETWDQVSARITPGAVRMQDYNLAAHKDHALALGAMVAAWSCVEGQLAYVHALLMRAPLRQSYAAFYALPTNHTRLNVIKALSEAMSGKQKFRLELLKLIRDVETLAERRNTYVHSQWCLGTNSEDVFLRQNEGTPQFQYQKIQANDMRSTVAEIMALSERLRQFANGYFAAHPLDPGLLAEELPEALREKYFAQPKDHGGGSDPQNQP